MTTNLKYIFKHCFMVAIPLMLLLSCKKKDVLTPNFDVTVSKTTYAVGEPITFNFTGTADQIVFYSGIPGQQYKYHDVETADGIPQLTFTSLTQYGPQANTLHLLVSKDFNAVYDVTNLQSATWTDITAKATLSTGVDNTPSGAIDLSAFKTAPNVPIYIAFKYTALQTTVSQPTWTIKNIAINNVLPDGASMSIAAIATLGWGTINVKGTQTWTTTTAQIQMAGGAINTPDNEDWLVTQPLYLDRTQRNFGVSIKSNPTTLQTSYAYAGFTAPGTYIVTFDAANVNEWNQKSTVKQITITVQ